MWLERAGRTSADIGHCVHCASAGFDDAPPAEARVVGVHLGADGRPEPLPEELAAIASSQNLPDAHLEPGEPPEDAWSTPIPVRPSDLDTFQHVHQAPALIVRAPASPSGAGRPTIPRRRGARRAPRRP